MLHALVVMTKALKVLITSTKLRSHEGQAYNYLHIIEKRKSFRGLYGKISVYCFIPN